MAVAIEMDFPGMTLDQYNQMIPMMGLTPGGATPPDAISHWVAETAEGLHVVDVWESREAFDRFTVEHLAVYSAELGYTRTPEMRFFDVRNHLGRGWAKTRSFVDIDVKRQRQVGNFPQAFSHLTLIGAAAASSAADVKGAAEPGD